MNNQEFLFNFAVAVIIATIWTVLAGALFLSGVYIFLTIKDLIEGNRGKENV